MIFGSVVANWSWAVRDEVKKVMLVLYEAARHQKQKGKASRGNNWETVILLQP